MGPLSSVKVVLSHPPCVVEPQFRKRNRAGRVQPSSHSLYLVIKLASFLSLHSGVNHKSQKATRGYNQPSLGLCKCRYVSMWRDHRIDGAGLRESGWEASQQYKAPHWNVFKGLPRCQSLQIALQAMPKPVLQGSRAAVPGGRTLGRSWGRACVSLGGWLVSCHRCPRGHLSLFSVAEQARRRHESHSLGAMRAPWWAPPCSIPS